LNSSRIFITGAKGQLGTALRHKYPKAKYADSDKLDITDKDSVHGYDWSDTDVLINAAGYTNVDGAETDEEAAFKVNATAVGYLAEAAKRNDMTLVHISTDYVFDGNARSHAEDEPFSPLSVYGKSKVEGDKQAMKTPKHYLVRTSWVIGEGKNFVRTMLGLGKKGVDPTVVADQIGRPTFTSELVRAIDHLLESKAPYGTYNVSNSGESVSWADLTRQIFQDAGFDNTVSDTTTEKYYEGKANIAARPANSTFDLSKIEATGFQPRDWKEDLREYIDKELGK
jgi:dTDP-4-dehydrorhamnose 3,5-epimerase